MSFNSFILLVISVNFAFAVDVPNIRLNTNRDIPIIGLGTWQVKGKPVVRAVKDALEAGYRHIDTAWLYRNEKDVGKAVRESIEKGIVKREDLFITTKVWPTDFQRKKALNVIRNSLNKLNMTYVDLVLLHFPDNNYTEGYKGLEDAFNRKLTRSIGVSNFNVDELKNLMKTAKIKPAMNQIRIHPRLNQEKTVQFCKKNGIAVTGYSPLGTGTLIGDPTLTEIGKKHNKSSAQVMIRWQIQRGLVVIPKSVHKERIIENFDVFDFELTDKEMKTISSMR